MIKKLIKLIFKKKKKSIPLETSIVIDAYIKEMINKLNKKKR